MRFERLVIEAGDNTFNLDFHQRLTVISGVGRLEREGLISELVGALSASRDGVHAEVVADMGTRFAIFRPHGARHRVVDVDASVDVSSRFADPDGEIDLLKAAGLDVRTAKRQLRLSAADLTTSTHHDQLIRHLATVDRIALWNLARGVEEAQAELDRAAESTGSAPEDAEVAARIEERHQIFEQAQGRAERYRRTSFLVGAVSALAAVPAAMLFSRVAAMVLVIVAGLVTALSFVKNQQMRGARKAEEAALAEAGADSYLGFHLQRVNGLLDSETSRQRVILAAANLEKARNAWHELAGEVTVEWANDYRAEIARTADLLDEVQGRSTSILATPEEREDSEIANLAHLLITRLNEARVMGPGGESLPLILDDPLHELSRDVKAPLLEMLVRSSVSQQIVFLTEDRDVIDWARLEAMTGDLAILEPTPADAHDEADRKGADRNRADKNRADKNRADGTQADGNGADKKGTVAA
jgi:hypothetical protein